jgi:chemotaxis protein methyltransferase CheR
MVLQEHADSQTGFDYAVLGSDLSSFALDVARRAVYPHREIEPVPMALRRKYLMRSLDREDDLVRIAPELRRQVHYKHMNFMDEKYAVGDKFHAIFCRNMLIYFDAPTQEQVVNRLASHLHRGGLFFTGHSETLARLRTPLVQIEPTIYRLPE